MAQNITVIPFSLMLKTVSHYLNLIAHGYGIEGAYNIEFDTENETITFKDAEDNYLFSCDY